MASDRDADDGLHFLTPSTRPDSLGRIGHYEVLQVLGKGGFGIVFRAFDDVLQRVVAIKVMAPQLAATSPARKRFLREARTSAAVRHENVVQVYEVAEHPLPYLAMEFIPGETLQQKLDRNGPLEVSETLRIGRQIAEGLAAAHATDLIHRDIKPGNILMEGGAGRVKITDFGLARAADDASISQSGIIAGTPMYMAPEQAKGDKLDQRADLFSLGSVLYQMVSGHAPFRANSTLAVLKRVADETPRAIREIIPEAPQWLCDIISKLHEKNPDDRYQSAREVADVLADCEAQLKADGAMKNYSRIPGVRRHGRSIAPVRWIALSGLAAVVAAGLVAIVAVLFFRDSEPKPNDAPIASAPPPVAGLEPWRLAAIPTAQELADRPSPLDALNREDIPADVLAKAGGGDPAKAPAGLVAVWPIHDGQVFYLALSADGRTLATISEGDIKVTDLAAGGTSTVLARGKFSSVAFSPDGKLLAAGTTDGPIRLWAMPTQKPMPVLLFHRGGAIALAFSPDSARLASAGGEAKVCARYVADGRQVWSRTDHAAPGFRIVTYAVAYSPDGTALVSGGVDRRVIVRDPDTGVPVDEWNTPDVIRGLAFKPDSRSLAVSTLGPQVELRDRTDGKSLGILPGKTEAAPGTPQYAMSPVWRADGGLVVWCEAETDMIHLCDLTGPEPRTRSFQGYLPRTEWLQSLALTPEGRYLLTANPDGSVYVIRLAGRGEVVRVGGVIGTKPSATAFKNTIGMEFVKVPEGKAWLGGGKDRPGQQEVKIPADFYLGKYEVTQEEWEKVMGENPSHFSRTGKGSDAVKDISDADLKRFPVENVSWDQCQQFVAKLNKLEKETGWIYRLPKEAEWEYACRGGPMTDKAYSAFEYYFAKPTNILLPEQANFKHDTSRNRPCKVSTYEPNALGLYDMHGNVWEWSEEEGGEGRPGRVFRGGSWHDGHGSSWAGASGWAGSESAHHIHLGFRLARIPSGDPSPEAKTPPTAVGPFTDADAKRIAALPAAEQVEEVRKELMRRNPGFDGKAEHKIEGGVVTELTFTPVKGQDAVTDLSPVRALPGLTMLNLWGCSGLVDLEPLKGLKLARLIIGSFHVSHQVRDLEPLKGMKLTELSLYHCQVQNLEPLKDMPLTRLILISRQVRSCEPLKGMPLTTLYLDTCTQIKDFTPLQGMPLTVLALGQSQFKDAELLKGMPLTVLTLGETQVQDLEPLRGMPLEVLRIHKTGVTDLKPLQGMELEEIRLTPKNITQGLDILRDMKSLKTIGIDGNKVWKPAEFWARYDNGEFKE